MLSFQSEGQEVTFSKYLVEENEEVKKGTPLADFTIGYDEAYLSQLELKLKRAKEDYEKNLQDYENAVSDAQVICDAATNDRDKKLQNLVVKKKQLEYDQYKISSKDSIEQLEEELKEYKNTILITQLYAPFDCVVGLLNRDIIDGDMVDPKNLLAMIYSEEGIQFQVTNIDHELYYNMKVSIEFTYEGESYSLDGKVISDSSTLAGSMDNTVMVIAEEEPDEKIQWSKVTKITITAKHVIRKDALMIDMNAVYMKGDVAYVRVLEDGVIRKQSVVVADDNGENCWIFHGVEEGQTILMK